jgi:organic radical activating enzyme
MVGVMSSVRHRAQRNSLAMILRNNPELRDRLQALREFSRGIRTNEIHITNACNLRCRGCWYFEYGFDRRTVDERDLSKWRDFARQKREAGITHCLLIGGEPTLHLDRIELFLDLMPYVTISTNGIVPIPFHGSDRIAIAITLFGDLNRDDRLRGIRANGSLVTGLFDRALINYKNDARVVFVYALESSSINGINDTIRKIADNGNRATFNYYSQHGSAKEPNGEDIQQLLDAALCAKEAYPETVVSHPEFIRTLITGKTDFADFGYSVCPSISEGHPAHRDRLVSGKPVLPRFNSFASDLQTINFCCTSGRCDVCRDSQAIYSWLLMSFRNFSGSTERIATWIEIAESYWRHFAWSPYSGT